MADPLDSQTFADILDITARWSGDTLAFQSLPDIQANFSLPVTYRDFVFSVRQTANLIRNLGEHTNVALIVPNTVEGQTALFASQIAGQAVPINGLLPDEQTARLINAAGANILIVDSDMDRAEKLRALSGGVEHIFTINGDQQNIADCRKKFSGEAYDFDVPTQRDDPVVAAFHTGGTTGQPKLALHLASNQLATARGVIGGADLKAEDVILNPLPLFHVAGSICVAMSALVCGACQLLPPPAGGRTPGFIDNFWILIEKYKVTVICGVPTIFGAAAARLPEKASTPSPKILSGGASLATTIESALLDFLGSEICLIYGMTETAGLICVRHHGETHLLGSVGRPADGVEIRIVIDPENADAEVKSECSGHILARGDTIGPGYLDETQRDALFNNTGWLITGDLGHIDRNGHLKITGRAKDVIIRSGHNIDASVIEEAALQHPSIELAAAVSAPDSYAGELPFLFVQLKPKCSVAPDEIFAHLLPILERPALPKHVEILREIPQTGAGKIYKPTLAARATEIVVERLFEDRSIKRTGWSIIEDKGSHWIEVLDEQNRPAIQEISKLLSLKFK